MLCFNYFKTKNKMEKGGSVYIMFITDVKLGDDGGGEVDLWANGLDKRLGFIFFYLLFFHFSLKFCHTQAKSRVSTRNKFSNSISWCYFNRRT